MLRCSWLMSLVAVLLCGPLVWSAEDPAKKSALDLLPPSTMAYVEMPRPPKLVSAMLDHPLVKQLEQQPDFQQALDTADMQQLREVVKVFEDKLGKKWRPALESLTAEGVYAGFELSTQGVVLLVRADDAALLEKTRDTFVELARKDAADKGQDDPIKSEQYNGVTAYKVADVYYATVGPWLVLTNKSRLGQMVLDNALEAGRPSLKTETQFATALQQKPADLTAWAYVDLTILRLTGVGKAVLDKKGDNPAVELIVGGILGAVPDANFVTVSVAVQPQRIAVSAAVPFDAKKVGKKREYFFGVEAKGAAPALLAPEGTIVSLSTYRDFGLMWKNAPDLFDDNINAKFAEAESNLATLFSGKSFPDDILSNLEPGLQMVVAQQRFGKDDVAPQIKLPATALVFTMKNPEETARNFKITYQSLVGFLNIAGAQGGVKEPLEQNTEKLGDIMVASATYIPPKEGDRQAAGIHFNASPTVAFVKDKFVISSTKALAIEIAQALEKEVPAAESGVNTRLRINGEKLQLTLADNRAQLVAQNQTDKGHSEAEAEKEIDLLMQLLQGFRETSLSLTTTDDTLRLSWELLLAK